MPAGLAQDPQRLAGMIAGHLHLAQPDQAQDHSPAVTDGLEAQMTADQVRGRLIHLPHVQGQVPADRMLGRPHPRIGVIPEEAQVALHPLPVSAEVGQHGLGDQQERMAGIGTS